MFVAKLKFLSLAPSFVSPFPSEQYVWSTIPLVVKLIEQSSGLTPILVIRSTVPPGTTLKWEAEVRAKTDKPFQVQYCNPTPSTKSSLFFLAKMIHDQTRIGRHDENRVW